MPDITALIMDDHEWFRRQFAALDDAREPADLDAIWGLSPFAWTPTPMPKKPSSTRVC